ncbi:hypothetical protein ABT112_13580 [Streptomyces sp. NPDC002055]|uniref:hypothetical protein n=1 Tax=Streptomyces sp. NPDC002055 TaxID=3154534 RepID=UPI00332BABDE
MSAPVARVGADLRLLRAAVFAAVCVALSMAGHALASCSGVPAWTLITGFLLVFAAAAPLAGRERTLPGISAGLAVGQSALHGLFWLGQQAASAPAPPAGRPSNSALISFAARLVCGGDAGPARLTAAEARRIISTSGPDHPAHAAGAHIAGSHATGANLSGTHGAGTGAVHAAVPAPPPGVGDLVPSLPMLLGHLLAAVALGLLLRRGEAALFRLVRLSARGVSEGFAEGALVRSLRAALVLVRALHAGLPGSPAALPPVPPAHGTGKAGPRSLVLEHSVSRRGPPDTVLAA